MVGIDREDMTMLLWRRSFDMKYLLFNSMDADLYYSKMLYFTTNKAVSSRIYGALQAKIEVAIDPDNFIDVLYTEMQNNVFDEVGENGSRKNW